MYAAALTLSGVTTAATTGVPFFQLGSIGPIQSFGIIVAAGVLIGAALLRRYAEWHGLEDDHIRGLLGWVTICGFLGAHEFDMIAYQWDKIGVDPNAVPPSWWFLSDGLWVGNWPLPLRIWDGISSYGGFLGGAMGFATYVWWKRLPVRFLADTTIIGLLPAFSIGRIGCTVVSDHVGAPVSPDAWYAFIAMDYPRESHIQHLFAHQPAAVKHILAWNLGLVELLYLIPVNALVLWLAFRPTKRMPAGFIAVLAGLLYAPVRFFLDFLRPEDSDPRYIGLTFAQWASILAFVVSAYVAAKILKSGTPHPTVAKTAAEAQVRLRVLMKEAEEADKKRAPKAEPAPKKSSSDDDDDEKREVPKAIARKAEPKRKSSADDDTKDDDAKSSKAKSAEK